ncbi:MAG: hypothetical protein H0W08_11555 [Acidobacteria bacterium]|nr:hypothetical protein [Acidobacteriota bacterium]
MSIPRRITSHLDDAAFAELWTNALADGTAPSEHPHLRGCAECRIRFTSFSNWLEELRDDAVGEAQEVIKADRLASQQAQIFRRLEAATRPARVLAFPRPPAGAMRPSPVRRWVAAAAAAGVLTGIGLGQLLDLRSLSSGPSTFPADRITASGPRVNPGGPIAVPLPASFNEAATLAELEEAAIPDYEALRAYDTFTPRAGDFIKPR